MKREKMASARDTDICSKISTIAELTADHAGRSVKIIREPDAVNLGEEYHLHLQDVFSKALGIGVWPYRYIRNRDTLSIEDQIKLIRSKVAVIGAGGLGGYIVLLLARAGVGSLVIVDPETFEETNLNRQALATCDTLGQFKADVAVKTVESVNPAVRVFPYRIKLDLKNASKILDGVHVIADALDNIASRLMLQDAAAKFNIPMVHGAVAGFEGQVMSVYPGNESLTTIYEGTGNDNNKAKAQSAESILGVPSVTPAVIGALQVMEILKILLGRGKVIQKRLLYAQLETDDFQEFDL